MALTIDFTPSGLESFVYDEKASVELRPQGMKDVTEDGEDDPVYVNSRYITIPISANGKYGGQDQKQLREKLRAGASLAVKLATDHGDYWDGSIYLSSISIGEVAKGKTGIKLTGRFSGTISEQDGRSFSVDTIGKKPDIKRGARVRAGYQNTKIDRAVRPFFIDGVVNASNGLHSAISAIVASVGGASHGHPGDSSLPFYAADAQWFGPTQVAGHLTYARGDLDCNPALPQVSTGFVDWRGTEGGAVESLSSGGPCDVASVTIHNIQRRRKAVKHIRLRCVWNAEPNETDHMGVATINNNSYTIGTRAYSAFELRFDGFDYEGTETRRGNRYPGWMKWTWMEDGWTSHKLVCVRFVPVDTGSTLPSYVLQFETQQRYLYPGSDFVAVGTLCSECYG